MDNQIKKPLVKWTEEEWEKFAIALFLEFPEHNLATATKIPVSVGPAMAVMRKTFEESRWRILHATNDYKPKLLKLYEKLRPTLIKHQEERAAIVEETIKQAGQLDVSASEIPDLPVNGMHTDNGSPDSDSPGELSAKSRASRIHWTADEWMQVAKELYRMNPPVLNSETLVTVKMPDILMAQRVLPPERQRQGIINVTQSREKLLPTFAVLRKEVKAQEEINKRLAEREAEAAKEAARNPFEVALEPLFALIKTEVIKALKPQLDAILSSLPQAQAPDLSALFKPAAPAAPKKPKIAVIGAMPTQIASIALEFPELDVVETDKDSPHVVSTVRSCVKVFGMTKFMQHAEDGKLKKEFGDNYVRISGGTSEVKRIINTLLASGAIPKPAGQAKHH